MRASRNSFSLILFLASVVFCGTAFCDSTTITGVQVSPDLRQVSIKFDGFAGKHSAFVIERPYRLVLDFDSTALARVPNRINVGRDPIDSIRLGQGGNGRARVVVDFGDHPVPPFRIDRQASAVIVSLASGSVNRAAPVSREAPVNLEEAAPRAVPVAKKPAVTAKPEVPKLKEPQPQQTTKKNSGMSVKSAGMAENFVFVEIADQKDPKRTYRLVIDMDREELNVRGATVSDPQGNVKRFQVMSSQGQGGAPQTTAADPEKSEFKSADTSVTTSGVKGKFKWGLQSSESDP
ncbi:MAG: AMIN domain-containing protein, partial [Desulfomonile tiedjei]|nr:AMIN domain-containing protein [Desulfomonile tiedjei]